MANISEWRKLKAQSEAPFVWDTRDKLFKRIKVRLLEQEYIIQVDRCSEYNYKNKLVENLILSTELTTYHSTVAFSQEGAKILTLIQKKKSNRNHMDFLSELGEQLIHKGSKKKLP